MMLRMFRMPVANRTVRSKPSRGAAVELKPVWVAAAGPKPSRGPAAELKPVWVGRRRRAGRCELRHK